MLIRPVVIASALAFIFNARPAACEHTMRIGIAEGAVYDGILDGFPGIAAFDGTPDLGGNQPAVSLKLLVTEERAIAEFPLPVAVSQSPDRLVSAAFSFNIDDVLSTFGPGTDFAGRAGRELLVHLYGGNGMIDLVDFSQTNRSGHRIDTTTFGTITDATLRASGPIRFEVDVTDDVRALLHDGTEHLGVVVRTSDSPTGTSVDDLGDGSSGPPGVGGAQLPFLTLVLGDEEATPSPTATPTATTPPVAPATPTATPSRPAMATPTSPSQTPLPTPAGCVGDCGRDDIVTVDELLTLVNIALGAGAISQCEIGDSNRDGTVTIDEIVLAVNHALSGCPAGTLASAGRPG